MATRQGFVQLLARLSSVKPPPVPGLTRLTNIHPLWWALPALLLGILWLHSRKTVRLLRNRLEDFDGYETCFEQGFQRMYEDCDMTEDELLSLKRSLRAAPPLTKWAAHEVLQEVHLRALGKILR